MGMGKWIGGVIGWMAGGPLGALAGYAIGYLFESSDAVRTDRTFPENGAGTVDEGQRNSFLFSLLAMSSYVICADGRIMHSEMEYVRHFLRMNFGEGAVSQGEQILQNLFEQKKQMDSRSPQAFRNTIRNCGAQIAANMTYEQRLQLLSYLTGIARADGKATADEVEALKEVARSMGLTEQEVESLLNMGGTSTADAYKVLEIEPAATNEEVRSAYRALALKHHPDKVASLGEDVQKAAEEKFKCITEAYDIIRKERGL